MDSVLPILACMCAGGAVGWWIGSLRDRPGDGLAWGALLGPIGWLVVYLGPDNRRKCQECRGAVPSDATRCMHCGAELRAMMDIACPACGGRGQIAVADQADPVTCPMCQKVFTPRAPGRAAVTS